MQEIFCPIDGFMLKQKIYKIDPETGEKELLTLCNFTNLAETLESIMKSQNVFTLHLAGDQQYIEDIGEKIETVFNLKYEINEVKIKYN